MVCLFYISWKRTRNNYFQKIIFTILWSSIPTINPIVGAYSGIPLFAQIKANRALYTHKFQRVILCWRAGSVGKNNYCTSIRTESGSPEPMKRLHVARRADRPNMIYHKDRYWDLLATSLVLGSVKDLVSKE